MGKKLIHIVQLRHRLDYDLVYFLCLADSQPHQNLELGALTISFQ